MNKQIKKSEVYEAPGVNTFVIHTRSCIAASLWGSTESDDFSGENEEYIEENGSWVNN